ncbi:hypothetical protein K458DRAFT_475049 [Lentithecium fluviatile CBS 122367]|uniref:Rad21/Rec8-like protein N-terminal domain-containing protein n=1 Tax=Lentithecium fluviatile CBS 122367 TaxID=1168545 RepID=A0A6G1JHF2_9PLEO|nr:hypothetical protein K458DRAFT_475049 [Lentithecium fluviatile CBS 122367]
MFYSHEVLTSRKYGVATVWLVATLGSKSNSKKINRKAILGVDVPKACRTIVDPAAPMALRLQGNLLYGVSRVYLQQCDYVLSDAQNAYSSMHMMLRAMKSAALDPEAGKAKPEQLVLPDDPSFLPEFALPPPELLAELNLGPALEPLRNGDSQSLTPFGSQQPTTPGGPIGGLILPSSSSVGAGEFVIHGDNGLGALGGPSALLGGEDLDDPGFAFDDNGNIIDFEEVNVISGTPAVPGGATMPSDAGASARVRQEHEEGLQAGAQFGDQMELDLPIFGDDLPEGEAFPTASQQRPDDPGAKESSSLVVAPVQRKKRAARTIPLDTTLELRNKDLLDWNVNYLQNMKEASRTKDQQRLAQLAKKRAEWYVWGSGIGGVAARFVGVAVPSPFDRFIGDNLFELFTGISRKGVAGTKRDRDSGIDDTTQGESRHVRQRTNEAEDEIGRGQEDEAMFILGGEEVELPREAPSALDDQQIFSAMPWNITASVRGSSAVPRSARVGMAGSVGALSSLTGMHGRRGSRMVSASPLRGRGQPGGLDTLVGFKEGEDEFSDLPEYDFGAPDLSSDMPEAALAQPTVRVCEALSAEGENFLDFIVDAIDEKRDRIQAGLEPMSDVLQAEAAADIDVSFEELLSPLENTKMVASQAFLMALALGTKGLLDVHQESAFEEITLSLTEKARVAQAARAAIPAAEGGEGDDEEMEGGQFEEQFAAGRAHSEGDEEVEERDSLHGD